MLTWLIDSKKETYTTAYSCILSHWVVIFEEEKSNAFMDENLTKIFQHDLRIYSYGFVLRSHLQKIDDGTFVLTNTHTRKYI